MRDVILLDWFTSFRSEFKQFLFPNLIEQLYQAGTKVNNQAKIMQTTNRLPENLSNDLKILISRTLQFVRTLILANGSCLLNGVPPLDP